MSKILVFTVIQLIRIVRMQTGDGVSGNDVGGPALKDCLNNDARTRDVGVCFRNELLRNLHQYDESETFSLANGVSFIRDEAAPRDFASFLDKDPTDFRSIMEGASDLISKRSLHWDMGSLCPGLIMRISPSLANGVLEFVIDQRLKDRAYQNSEDFSTGRLLSKNLLVPLLLGFKFQLSTLLPLILGLVLLASKKAFFLAKLAIVAMTVFGGAGSWSNAFGGHSTPIYSSPYSSAPANLYPNHGGYYSRPPEYYYKEKSVDPSTASPITPTELRDRLERLFITKSEINQPREERDGRNYAWSPVG